jgi:hypothetical protein
MYENIIVIVNVPLKRELQFIGHVPTLKTFWELIMDDSCDKHYVQANNVITYVPKMYNEI